MQVLPITTFFAAQLELTLEHKNEKIDFCVSNFGKRAFEGIDVFHYLNQYWSTLPENIQDDIFNIYKEIKFALEHFLTTVEKNEFITKKIAQLMQYHQLEYIKDWQILKSDIIIPRDFKNEYVHDIDSNTSREKTYTKQDYVDLVSLAISLKCIVPIWGDYIQTIKNEVGTKFKESAAFRLINASSIRHSTTMTKLRTYIEHIAGDAKKDPNNIMSSISSEDHSDWLLALVCVRRLALGDISNSEPDSHLIKLIYKFIIQKIQNTNDSNANSIRFKSTSDSAGEGNHEKISMLERFKLLGNLSLGDIVSLEFSMSDINSVVERLSIFLDKNLLNRSLNSSKLLLNEQITDFQINILRWVFKPVISPRGMLYLPSNDIVNALGALEALLWSKGFKYLAVLATSHPVRSGYEMMISPTDSKNKIPKELIDELDKLYPFHRPSQGKLAGRSTNPALLAIDSVVDNMSMYSLRATACEEMLAELEIPGRQIKIRHDIKTELAKLILDIGSRKSI